MQIYGIIGYPLGHSCSPRYFNEKFQKENIAAEYRSFEMPDIRQLPTLLQQTPDLCGFNVTIPHKQNILPFLDEISEEARVIGAVNCVKVSHPNGHPYLVGYNTDMYGFRKALLEFIPAAISKALILGNGGAAKAVRYALHSLNMEVSTVSRTPRQADDRLCSVTGLNNRLSADRKYYPFGHLARYIGVSSPSLRAPHCRTLSFRPGL